MARSRNIKPGFFANDKLAEVAPLGRLLFAALWTLADRAGRLEDRPKRIKAEALPYDSCDVCALLDDLARLGFIVRYVVDGIGYIQVVNFAKHQQPHIKEVASTIPAPDKHGASTVQAPDKHPTSPSDSGFLIPDSGFLIPDTSAPSEHPRASAPVVAKRARSSRPRAEPATTKPDDVTPGTWSDFVALRKAKRSPLTQTALAGIASEAAKARITLEAALSTCCVRGWTGFRAEWVSADGRAPPINGTKRTTGAHNEAVMHDWLSGGYYPPDDGRTIDG